MHECPQCGYDCDCDGEDTFNDVPDICLHDCDDDDADFDERDDYDDLF